MKLEAVANALKELGHPTRLSIYKALVRSGENGLPVGELQKRLEIPNSTLSHHISALVSAGLLQQRREGRILYCVPQYEVLSQIVSFLVEECCAEQER
ncbi:ArsR family transcriptional regulator [Chania multitudinisentens RB-25]|uniref:ArsR family transcriptional regulator n=1 Tax=Chania multitudinisentens RB-25 TaxID=1441930 RepID=W0LAG2_9GAMM|nr:metalloregulator ArsR/SmtB family transcription factor [Chania multitudinisentens]AHG20721.1 ArsR family transcriptional regulator [Chania multitudinisentens RB-25]